TTRLIDLYPTLVASAGLPAGPETNRQGRSLLAAWRGEQSIGDEPAFAESLTPLIHYGWSDLRSVRDGRWKYILAPHPELYDLARDPQEQNNLEQAEAARARAMRAGLEAQLRAEAIQVKGGAQETASVPADLLEKLGALGYVGAGG